MRSTYINTTHSRYIVKKNNRFGYSKTKTGNTKKTQAGLFGYSANSILQVISLIVIVSFGILLLPNLLTENTPKANAQEPKRVQLVTNFETPVTSNSSQPSQLVSVEIATTNTQSNSSVSSNKAIPNPDFAAGKNKTYKIVKGDTLASIATKFNLDPIELAIINGLKTSRVEVGTDLKLP